MSKLKLFLTISLLMMVGCQKDRDLSEPENKPLSSAPEWLIDEGLPVPIEFGVDAIIETKADNTIEENGLFHNDSFRYGVVALDQYGTRHSGVNGIAAKNVPTSLLLDGAEGLWKSELVGGPYYYPVLSDRDYSFYAYRTDNTNTGFALTDSNEKENIAVGLTDVIWAKSVATPIGGSSLQAPLSGFNAKYLRALMDAENYSYFYLTSPNAPKFQFQHLMSRFVFVIKAENEYAEDTMAGLVSIDKLLISGFNDQCSLNVLSGALTATGSQGSGSLDIPREDGSTFYPVRSGAQWGDPVFVLPSVVDQTAATQGITLHMFINAPDNPWYEYVQILRVNGATDGFEAGKSYKFTITLKSYEKIEVVTEIADWDEIEVSDNIEIG